MLLTFLVKLLRWTAIIYLQQQLAACILTVDMIMFFTNVVISYYDENIVLTQLTTAYITSSSCNKLQTQRISPTDKMQFHSCVKC